MAKPENDSFDNVLFRFTDGEFIEEVIDRLAARDDVDDLFAELLWGITRLDQAHDHKGTPRWDRRNWRQGAQGDEEWLLQRARCMHRLDELLDKHLQYFWRAFQLRFVQEKVKAEEGGQ